ncbi:MAG TPA: RlpA-like double-psi beta-barrel domain-containing protein [Acetobacteraceae bacterium]|nr:RlpA-like double-psi beta-barrel domain-containing protein [Acetobacteraceae bacterium]
MITRTSRFAAALGACALALLLASCGRQAPPAHPHYVLGQPYQSGGVWWYPREQPRLDATGLAVIYAGGHQALTTDGEVFSQDALAVAHPTLPLPAIARLTDLQTGRSLLVRINDRGTPRPNRLVQVTRRVAALLGMPRDGVAEVRLTLLPGQTASVQDAVGGAPRLSIAAAPVGRVQAAALPPPSGVRQEAGRQAVLPAAPAAALPAESVRLDGTVTQESPRPGRLWVRLDTFQSYQYAAMQRAKLVGLAPRIESVFDNREQSFRVMLGPFTDVAAADSALDRAIAAGVSDARIVVE